MTVRLRGAPASLTPPICRTQCTFCREQQLLWSEDLGVTSQPPSLALAVRSTDSDRKKGSRTLRGEPHSRASAHSSSLRSRQHPKHTFPQLRRCSGSFSRSHSLTQTPNRPQISFSSGDKAEPGSWLRLLSPTTPTPTLKMPRGERVRKPPLHIIWGFLLEHKLQGAGCGLLTVQPSPPRPLG